MTTSLPHSKLAAATVESAPLTNIENMLWLGDVPSTGAAQCPEKTAIIFAEGKRDTSYAELERQTNAFASYLKSQNFQEGDRIAYLGANNDRFFPILFGCIRAGVVLLPINWRLVFAEIGFQLADAGAKLLIHDKALLAQAEGAVDTLKGSIPRLLVEDDIESILAQAAEPVATPKVARQVVQQLYTSGTTGKPKGVQVSHFALSAIRHAELQMDSMAHFEMGCMSLSAMPNFHVGGMSWALMGLVRQGTVVITANPMPSNMLKLIREYGCEHSFIVPTVLRAIVDEIKASDQPAPPMKGIYYGAMPIGASLLNELLELFSCPMVQFFGMTEITGSGTILAPNEHDLSRPELLKSVGRPYDGMAIQIRDADQKVLKQGEHGEIWIKSPSLMNGYWQLPEKTAEAVVDGWYASGDGGYIGEGGYLYLTDRIKDMVVSGGENVYPAEVEEALRQHPAIMDAAVFGLPDERWGERVAALVELRPEQQLDSDAVIAHAKTLLAGFKCPKEIFFGSLPRTASGKIQRSSAKQGVLESL